MNKLKDTIKRKRQLINSGANSLTLSILVISFIAGIIAGSFISVPQTPEINPNIVYPIKTVYYNYIKYPLVMFFLGFTSLGIIFIPCAVFIKGFFVTSSISATLSAHGSSGLEIALSALGIQTLFSIPGILFISLFAMNVSKGLFFWQFKKVNTINSNTLSIRLYLLLFIVIAFFLFLGALLDVALTPNLISLAYKRIT